MWYRYSQGSAGDNGSLWQPPGQVDTHNRSASLDTKDQLPSQCRFVDTVEVIPACLQNSMILTRLLVPAAE